MKKWILFATVISLILVIASGCSQKSNEVKVNNENKDHLVKYDKKLQSFIERNSKILINFNNSLDKIYTNEASKSQFASILKENITKSNQLVNDVEGLDVSPDLFQAHQKIIILINESHQLLLTAIDMANQSDGTIDKSSLRTKYLEIKTSQANTVNEWKILREKLASEQQGQ